MEHDARDADPRPPHLQPPATTPSGDGHAPELDRLPPPFFPRGSTGRERVRSTERPSSNGAGPEAGVEEDGVPPDAFIDPDEPIRRSGDRISEDAFIDPDEPIVRTQPPRTPADFEEVLSRHEEEGQRPAVAVEEDEDGLGGLGDLDDMEVRVTGIGDDPHLDQEEISDVERYGDPHVADLVRKVAVLADALRDKGEAGLRSTSGMSRFEVTLRAYCVGYLAGRRAEEE